MSRPSILRALNRCRPILPDGFDTTGFVGKWSLQGNGNDSGPGGYDLTPTGDPIYMVGPVGNAFYNPATSGFNHPSNSAFDRTGAWTFATWIRFRDNTSGAKRLFYRDSPNWLVRWVETSNNVQVFLDGTSLGLSMGARTYGKWYHLMIGHDGVNTLFARFDNETRVTGTLAKGADTTTGTIYFYGGVDVPDADFDETYLFMRELSDEEQDTLRAEGDDVPYKWEPVSWNMTGHVCSYHFDGNGIDLGDNDLDLTPVNGPSRRYPMR